MGRSRAGMKDGYEALCPPFVYSKQIECGPSRDAVVVSRRHGACEFMLAIPLTKQASTLHSPHSTLHSSAVCQRRILARKGKQPEGESAAGGLAFCAQQPRPPRGVQGESFRPVSLPRLNRVDWRSGRAVGSRYLPALIPVVLLMGADACPSDADLSQGGRAGCLPSASQPSQRLELPLCHRLLGGRVRCGALGLRGSPGTMVPVGLDRFLWSPCYAHATVPPTRGQPAVLIGWPASGGRLG